MYPINKKYQNLKMIYKDPNGPQKYQFTKVSQPIQTLSPKTSKSGNQ